MRKLCAYCKTCKKETKQIATLESYLGIDAMEIHLNYWTRCLECGNNAINKNIELNADNFDD